MANRLALKDLKQGNIIKVEFGNGDVFKGCFFGKRYVHHVFRRIEVERGNYLVVLHSLTQHPYVLNLSDHKEQHKTSIKTITATRFNKEVSRYLKRYVRALDKQQAVSYQEWEIIQKRQAEDDKVNALEREGSDLAYSVHADDVLVDERVLLVFQGFDTALMKRPNVNQADPPRLMDEQKENIIQCLVTFKSALRVDDSDIGVIPDFEYDGSYHPIIEENRDVPAIASNYLSVTPESTQQLIDNINALPGISVKGDRVFSCYTGDYAGDGSIDFHPFFVVDRNVKAATLEKLRTYLWDFSKDA